MLEKTPFFPHRNSDWIFHIFPCQSLQCPLHVPNSASGSASSAIGTFAWKQLGPWKNQRLSWVGSARNWFVNRPSKKWQLRAPLLWCNNLGANRFTTRVTPNTAQESQTTVGFQNPNGPCRVQETCTPKAICVSLATQSVLMTKDNCSAICRRYSLVTVAWY